MSFMDAIKRSLGFEESEPSGNQGNYGSPRGGYPNQNPYGGNPGYNPRRFDDIEPISPEQPFYEIVLIRPKSIDDINYVIDQIIEEKNPVILDLSFLESESPSNYNLAGEKIKQMRARYGAEALLLSRTTEKNLIIISPDKIKLVKKS